MKCIYLRICFFSERECRYVCFPLMHSTIIERSEFTHQIIHDRHSENPKFGLQYMEGIYVNDAGIEFLGVGGR